MKQKRWSLMVMLRNKPAFATLFVLFLVIMLAVQVFVVSASSLSLEETISRRKSIHQSGKYTAENITQQQLLGVLRASYGYLSTNYRSIPSIGNYSLLVYVVNATGSYRYSPENHSLFLHSEAITKETVKSNAQIWPSEASVVLVVVWNRSKMENQYFASAEAGCLVQNIYLAANVLDLGTCCVGSVNSAGLRSDLNLPSGLVPLLVMPLGYPVTPYPSSCPAYDSLNNNLQSVQYSNLTFEDAVRERRSVDQWSSKELSLQEISQLLWTSYGFSNTTHRTTPSSWGIYPLVIYTLNSTGTYHYLPTQHSTEKILYEDKRSEIATILGEPWAGNAPTFILISYNSSFKNGNTGDGSASGSGVDHEFIEIDAGCVIQNVFLESTAWNLETAVIGLEDWNGKASNDIRNILGLTSDIIPRYLMPIGHKSNASNKIPIASFNYSPIAPTIQDAVYFSDTSNDPDGSIVAWYWDFGDSETSAESNPSHRYSDKGSFLVQILVTDNDGGKASINETLIVFNLPPTAGFEYSPYDLFVDQNVQFTDQSSDPEGNLVSWDWDFGDRTDSSEQNPIHKYVEVGVYTVTLTVSDDEGLTSTKTIELNIRLRPSQPFWTQTWFYLLLSVVVVAVTVVIIGIKLRKRT